MKKLIKIFLSLSLPLPFLLCGCQESPKEKTLGMDVIENSHVLQADTIDLSGIDIPTSQYLYVYNDSNLIVKNYKRDGNYLIELYNLHTKKLYRKLFRIGRGHGEVLLCETRIEGNRMFVQDFQQQKFCIVNLDSAFSEKEYTPVLQNMQDRGISTVAFLNGKQIVGNSYAFNDERAGIHQEGEKLLTSDKYAIEQKKEHKYNVQNVASAGQIIVKPDNEKVVYADGNQSFIGLYDKNLKRELTITGPIDLKTKYHISKEKEVVFKKEIPYTYTDGYCTSDEFGLIYYGTLVDAMNYDFDKRTCHLFIFDWDGNLKKSYKLNCHVKAITPSQKYPGSYYICSGGENTELKLLRVHE